MSSVLKENKAVILDGKATAATLRQQTGVRAAAFATRFGVIVLAKTYGIDLIGKRAVVVGASNIVGRPMALELLLARSTVTVCHTGTKDVRAEVERAEVVVVGVGKPEFVPGEWIRPGA